MPEPVCLWWHLESRVDTSRIVVVYLLVDGFGKLAECMVVLRVLELELELVVERLLIAVFPRRGLFGVGRYDIELFKHLLEGSADVFASLIGVEDLRSCFCFAHGRQGMLP